MVNWKLLTIAGLAYLGSYGIDKALDNRVGYNSIDYGLRQGDRGMYQLVQTAKPMSDKLSELVKTQEFSWNEPHLRNNENRVLQGANDLTGYAQIASVIAGFLALAGVGSRKKE